MGSKRSHDRRPQSVCAWHIEALEPRVLLSNTLIPVAGAQDVVFDASRDQLDILATSAVQRFDILRQRLLSPIAVDGQLLGGDITPDNRFLYAANGLGG